MIASTLGGGWAGLQNIIKSRKRDESSGKKKKLMTTT
jgi:hypothetical protein